jgi:hypothetical protein
MVLKLKNCYPTGNKAYNIEPINHNALLFNLQSSFPNPPLHPSREGIITATKSARLGGSAGKEREGAQGNALHHFYDS